MKRYFKIGMLILLGIFLLLQLYRPKKNIHDGIQVNNITKLVPINDTMNRIFKKACYDCHSNNTVYPWYSQIMPISLILNNHVVDGKKHFNFDEFTTYKAKKALKKIEEVGDEVEHNAMPISSYTRMHKDAILSNDEKQLIINWAKNAVEIIKVKYVDSFPR
jgi:hypothetical protein